jgi:hypothetical protein
LIPPELPSASHGTNDRTRFDVHATMLLHAGAALIEGADFSSWTILTSGAERS